jgi:HlyD family secretion protein
MALGFPSIGKILRTAFKLAVVVALAGAVVYQMYFAPVTVRAQKVAKGTVIAEVMGTGTLEARVRNSISPKISGRLVQLLVDQGERVTKGQLLATLDDGDLKQQVEVAKAELAVTRASVDRSAIDIVRADATVALTRLELARVTQSRQANAASANELDQATERHDVAEADTKRAQLAKVETEKAVIKAEESLRYYQERLADTKIVAPFDGLVVRRSRDPGDIVVPGTAILDVISTAELWVSAWVDETAMGRLDVSQPARIVFRSAPDTSLPGKVVRLAPQTDRETREFLVDVGVNQLPKVWAVGQRADVYIETARHTDVLTIPQRLVSWRDGKAGVMVDDAGKAQWQKVSLGLRGVDNVEIMEGITLGQVVISVPPGAELPRDGRAIRYNQP